jgi:hypothetical protein
MKTNDLSVCICVHLWPNAISSRASYGRGSVTLFETTSIPFRAATPYARVRARSVIEAASSPHPRTIRPHASTRESTGRPLRRHPTPASPLTRPATCRASTPSAPTPPQSTRSIPEPYTRPRVTTSPLNSAESLRMSPQTGFDTSTVIAGAASSPTFLGVLKMFEKRDTINRMAHAPNILARRGL